MAKISDGIDDATGVLLLLQALRSWNPWRRRAAADSLAQKGTPEAIAALKGMANGDKRNLLFSYNLKDQLMAVKCLGKSKRPEALKFLENMYSPIKSTRHETYQASYGPSDYITVKADFTDYTYPQAPLKIRPLLDFCVEGEDATYLKIIFEERVHAALRTAIETLRADLGTTPRGIL